MRKIRPYSKLWQSLANIIARQVAPEIFPCAKCGYPVLTGYCCGNCGDANPTSKEVGQ